MDKLRKSFLISILVVLCMALVLTGCPTEEADPVLESIAVTTQPTKLTYAVGETFDATGMVVTATYDDDSTVTVAAADYTVTGFDSTAVAEDKVVTVTYQGKTATFTVDIITNIKQAGTATGVAEKSGTYTAYLGGEACQVTLTSAKVDGTEKITDAVYIGTAKQNGNLEDSSYDLVWNAYDSFYGTTGLGDAFTLVYTFTEKSLGASNWNNFAFALMDSTNVENVWYLRADNWSNSVLSAYPSVDYTGSTFDFTTYSNEAFYNHYLKDKTLTLTVVKDVDGVTATLNDGTSDIYFAKAMKKQSYTVSLGGEVSKIDISSVKINAVEKLTEPVSYGVKNEDGTYTLAFGVNHYTVSEDLSLTEDWTVEVTFTQESQYANNWSAYNFAIKNNAEGGEWVCRADNYAWGVLPGFGDFDTDHWLGMSNTINWDAYASNFADKTLTLKIVKTATNITATLNNGGDAAVWTCVNPATE